MKYYYHFYYYTPVFEILYFEPQLFLIKLLSSFVLYFIFAKRGQQKKGVVG